MRRHSRRAWWLPLLLAGGGWMWRSFTPPSARHRTAISRRGVCCTASAPSLTRKNTVSDVVMKVHDGDTVTLQLLGKVRLLGVDAPELHQDGGPEAGQFARRMLLGQTVQVQVCAEQPHDRYGRSLAFLFLSDGRLFNTELIRQGYARVYSLRPCAVDEAVWNGIYEDARRGGRGLFARFGEVPNGREWRTSHADGRR